MDKINILKKNAISYLSKYDSTKKNLGQILRRKIIKMKKLEKKEKFDLHQLIPKILKELEDKNLINDKNFAENKIKNLFLQGKSEYYILNILLKKGVEKSLIKDTLINFENDNPNWKTESAELFAKRKKLGKFGDFKNKAKDLAKMARAGFSFDISSKTLGY